MATAMQSTRVAILGVDVGGTFTDAVFLDGGELRTAKVPSAARQEESVLEAARAVGARRRRAVRARDDRRDERAARTTRRAHGVRRRTAGSSICCTYGAQTRAHLVSPAARSSPEPLVPLERSYGVRGRIGPDGELEPLDLDSLPDVGDAEAVAVCLLFAFRDSSHEAAVAAALRERHPGAHVVASHEVAPEFREYERASTTAADAYLAPVAARYLRALADGAREAGLPPPLVMLVVRRRRIDSTTRRRIPRRCSSPAGGRRRRCRPRRSARAGFRTRSRSTWVGHRRTSCLLPGGRAARVSERVVGGLPIRLPTVDLHTVGAGGGSTRRRDAGGAIRVGPESAGAHPGPRVTAHGGGATVTDANLLLGRLPGASCQAVSCSTEQLPRARSGDLDPAAVIDVVNAEMLRALRVVSVERGHDPRDFALVAFGGAGPLHACALAEELGMEAVLVPQAAGVLSALGLVAGDERRDRVVSYVRPLAEVDDLPGRGRSRPALPRAVVRADGADASRSSWPRSIGPTRSGTAMRILRARSSSSPCARRMSSRGPTCRSRPRAGRQVSGPELVELPGATCWVPDGWHGETNDDGTLVLTR